MVDQTNLIVTDLVIGTGREIVKGALVVCHYIGHLDDGTKFDSSYDRSRAFEFVFGTGRVIKGWDQGLVNMREGGVRKLYVPAHLGYGERQMGEIIKPHSNLLFEIKLLEVRVRD
jgi:FKBP-type peptidyl-prolyl cis-trans isomerase